MIFFTFMTERKARSANKLIAATCASRPKNLALFSIDTMIHNALRVLIVDDEIEACQNLQTILTEYVPSDVQILGWAHDTEEAEAKITKLSPDVVFFDIEMPRENSLQFIERISPVNFEIVFVTA